MNLCPYTVFLIHSIDIKNETIQATSQQKASVNPLININ